MKKVVFVVLATLWLFACKKEDGKKVEFRALPCTAAWQRSDFKSELPKFLKVRSMRPAQMLYSIMLYLCAIGNDIRCRKRL